MVISSGEIIPSATAMAIDVEIHSRPQSAMENCSQLWPIIVQTAGGLLPVSRCEHCLALWCADTLQEAVNSQSLTEYRL